MGNSVASIPLLKQRQLGQTLAVYSADQGCVIDYSFDANGTLNSCINRSDIEANFNDSFVTQGLVDLQINGYAGIDFNQANLSSAAMDIAFSSIALSGVTSCLPTIISGTAEQMIDNCRSLDLAIGASQLGPHMVTGYHIEGPFLSPEKGYCGAHNSAHMTVSGIELVDQMMAVTSLPIKILTVAPEIPSVLDLIPQLCERGIRVAIGHSAANLQQIEAAVAAGATLSTHLGNGLPQRLHKTENPIFWQLAQDELTAMFIADGIHVPRSALKTMLRAKGLGRTILTTDAVAAAASQTPNVFFTLGATTIELSSNGEVRVPGSCYLAGSSVTMDQMVRNLGRWYDYSMPQILQMTRINPLNVLYGTALPEAIANPVQLVEWQQSSDGPYVSRVHIGEFIIE